MGKILNSTIESDLTMAPPPPRHHYAIFQTSQQQTVTTIILEIIRAHGGRFLYNQGFFTRPNMLDQFARAALAEYCVYETACQRKLEA